MAGGGQMSQQNPAAQAMQGANAGMMPQSANTQQMGLAQLQQALQKLGAPAPNATQQFGQGLASMGQQGPQQMGNRMAPQRPPMQQAAPLQGATPPQMPPGMAAPNGVPQGQMNGSMGMGQQGSPGGMTIQQLNALLAQRNGLMG